MKEANLFEPDVCNERTGKQKSFMLAGALLWQEYTLQLNHDSHTHLRNAVEGKKKSVIRKEYLWFSQVII